VAVGFPLLADSRNWHTTTNLFDLWRETYSHYWVNSSKPISALSQLASCYQLFVAGAPLKWISHIFWLKPLDPVFGNLKSKFPLLLKIKYQRFNGNERPHD
jgi:hypothetical protein